MREENYNPLLKRKELVVEIPHEGKGTPQRFDVRRSVASRLGAKLESVYVVGLRTGTGAHATICSVEIYDDPKAAGRMVPAHVLNRNLPPDQRVKKAPEAPAKVEPKAEMKASKPEKK